MRPIHQYHQHHHLEQQFWHVILATILFLRSSFHYLTKRTRTNYHRSLAVPTNPDLVIGYLVQVSSDGGNMHHVMTIIIFQTEIEQLTVTRDPGDVGEQCSNTWQPLEHPVQVVTIFLGQSVSQ